MVDVDVAVDCSDESWVIERGSEEEEGKILGG